LPTAEVDVGWREVLEALVVTPMVVVTDEVIDSGFEIALQEVVFEQNSVLQSLVPALDFSLRLRMMGSPAYVAHLFLGEPISEIASDVR
jgi:hypothetical protein